MPLTEIDNIVFRPLVSSEELSIEGFEQGHCVASYEKLCVSGVYRIYSVIEPDEIKSTLCLEIHEKAVRVQQHRGKFNGAISREAETAGTKFAKLYAHALLKQTKKMPMETNVG